MSQEERNKDWCEGCSPENCSGCGGINSNAINVEVLQVQEPVGLVPDHIALLMEARDYGQFAPDVIWTQAKPIVEAMSKLLDEVHDQYYNAAPCARCAEKDEYLEQWDEIVDDLGVAVTCINPIEDNKNAIRALQAKITEQADRIKTLEAEAAQWKIHAKEILSGEFDKVIHGLALQATIERQREVIELAKAALEETKAVEEYCRQCSNLPEATDYIADAMEGAERKRELALSAIAEFEKGGE